MTIKAHFDGKVIVPDEPLDLPVNARLEIVEMRVATSSGDQRTPLQRLADAVKDLPSDPDAPTDGAAQHDHYLYGTPKRP